MLGLAGPVLGAVGERLRSGTVDAVVQVLAWSPLGGGVVGAVGRRRGTLGGRRRPGAVAAVTLVVLWAVYVRAVRAGCGHRRRARARRGRRPRREAAPRGPAVLPDTPLGAMTGRALRYWVRDSRYQVSVLALPVVVGLLLVLPVLTDAPAAFALATGPLLGLMLGVTVLNELAFDGSAFWTGWPPGSAAATTAGARARAAAVGGPARSWSRSPAPCSAGGPSWPRPPWGWARRAARRHRGRRRRVGRAAVPGPAGREQPVLGQRRRGHAALVSRG